MCLFCLEMNRLAPMRRCNHPTCNKLIPFNERYCGKHKTYINSRYNDERQRNNPEYVRFYKSKEWLKARNTVLLENDFLCCKCGRQAALVDHIIPTKVDWTKRLDKENLQPLCIQCHNQKTFSENKK